VDVEALKHKFALFISEAQYCANPVDDLDRWRHGWARIKALTAEIDALDAPPPPDQ
jgi:hypothetical protein